MFQQDSALIEGWGDYVDPREYLRDDPSFMLGSGHGYGAAFTTINDRRDGKFLPVFETEQELAYIRATARAIASMDGIAIGAAESRANYVFGKNGLTFSAQSAKDSEAPAGLADHVQRLIDRLLDDNDFLGDMDREIFNRTSEDGECLVTISRHHHGVDWSIIEPDQLCVPQDPRGLYDWLAAEHGVDCMVFVPSWSFGVLTTARQTNKPLGYHVVFDGSGRDWEFFPASQFMHFKRNVPRNVKRGLSDYYPVYDDLRTEAKLAKNVGTGAALQAAIAWVEEYASGVTQPQVAALGTSQATSTITRTAANNGQQTTNQVRMNAGSIIRVGAGKQYKPGPMGAERNPSFMLAAQYLLRRIGVRWVMPEYMISGDASNANYASTLVAESPFVKARENDQQGLCRRFELLLWKSLEMLYRMGHFERFGLPWDQVEALIDVVIDAPEVATRNALELAQRQEIEIRMGTLSARTAAVEAGRDYDDEVKNGAAPQTALGLASTPVAESIDPVKAIGTMLTEAWRGYP